MCESYLRNLPVRGHWSIAGLVMLRCKHSAQWVYVAKTAKRSLQVAAPYVLSGLVHAEESRWLPVDAARPLHAHRAYRILTGFQRGNELIRLPQQDLKDVKVLWSCAYPSH
jgi:hypothetical protein